MRGQLRSRWMIWSILQKARLTSLEIRSEPGEDTNLDRWQIRSRMPRRSTGCRSQRHCYGSSRTLFQRLSSAKGVVELPSMVSVTQQLPIQVIGSQLPWLGIVLLLLTLFFFSTSPIACQLFYPILSRYKVTLSPTTLLQSLSIARARSCYLLAQLRLRYLFRYSSSAECLPISFSDLNGGEPNKRHESRIDSQSATDANAVRMAERAKRWTHNYTTGTMIHREF